MINQAILNRRSVRQYSDKAVSQELINEIIKAAQFAPTAINNRAWEFLVIEDELTKDKLYKTMDPRSRQEAVTEAPVVLIPLMNSQKSVLPVQDLSLAIQNIFIQVTELGLGSFWKNISAQEAKDIKTAFAIPEHFTILAVLPIGYPAKEVVAHTDEEFDDAKIHWGKW